MARVKLIVDKADVAPEHHALFDTLAARRGRISGPSTVVLHSPGLAGPWNEISEYLHGQSVVEPEHAELAVCATAREQDCAYVWNAHVPLARRAGLAEEVIAVVRDGGPVDRLPDAARAVVLYVRQLLHDHRVEGAVFDRLLKAHDPRWLVELTVWIGRYGALAGILNAFEVTPAAGAEPLPAAAGLARPRARVGAPLAAPRITPITHRDQLAAADRPVFDAVAEGRRGVRGPFGILLHSPELCRRHLAVGTYLRSHAQLTAAARELAIVATAREKDCPYVWAAHAPAARRASVSEGAIVAVRDRGDAGRLAEAERDVVDYVRQLLGAHRVAPPLFDRLRDRLGVGGLVELTALVGHYGIVTGILNAFEVAPAPDAEPLPLG
jgi:4-carboxymuconolactone decarboxylase